jgi:hypothetical protein
MRNYPPGPPMTLGNMRELGVQRLVAFGLNESTKNAKLGQIARD